MFCIWTKIKAVTQAFGHVSGTSLLILLLFTPIATSDTPHKSNLNPNKFAFRDATMQCNRTTHSIIFSKHFRVRVDLDPILYTLGWDTGPSQATIHTN